MADAINIAEINPVCLVSDAGKVIHAIETNGGKAEVDYLEEILSLAPYEVEKDKVKARIYSSINAGYLEKRGIVVLRTLKTYTPKLNRPIDECYEKKVETADKDIIIDIQVSKEEVEFALNRSIQTGQLIKVHLKVK